MSKNRKNKILSLLLALVLLLLTLPDGMNISRSEPYDLSPDVTAIPSEEDDVVADPADEGVIGEQGDVELADDGGPGGESPLEPVPATDVTEQFEQGYVRVRKDELLYADADLLEPAGAFGAAGYAWATVERRGHFPEEDVLRLTFDTPKARAASESPVTGFIRYDAVDRLTEPEREEVDAEIDASETDGRLRAADGVSVFEITYYPASDVGEVPAEEPAPEPTEEPTVEPTEEPTPEPTEEPTPEPTEEPTPEPTKKPTPEPTEEPTPEPTEEPTPEPTEVATPEPTEEPTPEPEEARQPRLAMRGETLAEVVNMRAEPTTESERVTQVKPAGAVVEVLDSVDVDGTLWFRVRWDGAEGYIRGDLLRVWEEALEEAESGDGLPAPEEESEETVETEEIEEIVETEEAEETEETGEAGAEEPASATLYAEPDADAEAVAHIPAGETLTLLDILEIDGVVWYRVAWQDVEGYAPADALGEMTLAEGGKGSFEQPYPCSVSEEKLNEMDFSSRRLLVSLWSDAELTEDTYVLGQRDDLYLLLFATAEETRNAYTYYVDRAAFAVPDTTLAAAEGIESVDMPFEDGDGLTPGDNPLARLSALLQGGSAPTQGLLNTGRRKQQALRATAGSLIALIDTGVSDDGIDRCSVIGEGVSDDHGHGDSMLGYIREENPNARVISIKALDASGRGSVTAVYAAVELAIARGASIINLSISARDSEGNAALASIIGEALGRGIVVVAAAGNNGANAKLYTPGNIPGVTTIGAVDDMGCLHGNSNGGDAVDFYVEADSTSEAAARFSGVISLSGSLPDFMDVVQPYLDGHWKIYRTADGEGALREEDDTDDDGFFTASKYINVTVQKEWADSIPEAERPDEVTVHLLANGEDTGKTLKLKKDEGWTGTFPNVSHFETVYDADAGKNVSTVINYTVSEDLPDGYSYRYAYDVDKVTPLLTGTVPDYTAENDGGVLRGGTSGNSNVAGSFMDGMPEATIKLNVDRLETKSSNLQKDVDFKFETDNPMFTVGFFERSDASNTYQNGVIYNASAANPIKAGETTKIDGYFRFTFYNAATLRDGSLANVIFTYSNMAFRNVDGLSANAAKTNGQSAGDVAEPVMVSYGRSLTMMRQKGNPTKGRSTLSFGCDVNVRVELPDGSPVDSGEMFIFSVTDLDVADNTYGSGSNGFNGSASHTFGVYDDYREAVWDLRGAVSPAYVPATAYNAGDFPKIEIMGDSTDGTANGLSFVAKYTDSDSTNASYDSGFAVLADARDGVTFHWTGQGANMGTATFAETYRDKAQAIKLTNLTDRQLTIKKVVDPDTLPNKTYNYEVQFYKKDDNGELKTVTLPQEYLDKYTNLQYVSGKFYYTFTLKSEETVVFDLPADYYYSVKELPTVGFVPSFEIADSTGVLKTGADETGTRELNSDQTVTFTNSMNPLVSLTVSKVITGNVANYLKEFDLTARFSPEMGGAKITMVRNGVETVITLDNDGNFADGSGNSVFTLGDGESVEFRGIPVGTTYRIEEANTEFDESYSVDDGNNTSGGATWITGRICEETLQGNTEVTFKNEREVPVPSGIRDSIRPALWCAIIALALLAFAPQNKRRARGNQRNKEYAK